LFLGETRLGWGDLEIDGDSGERWGGMGSFDVRKFGFLWFGGRFEGVWKGLEGFGKVQKGLGRFRRVWEGSEGFGKVWKRFDGVLFTKDLGKSPKLDKFIWKSVKFSK
jgi:hypothetical protein